MGEERTPCQFTEMALNQTEQDHCAASNIQPVPENLYQVEPNTILAIERFLFQVLFEKEKKPILIIPIFF
jgi:hypothetical protein